MLQQQKIVWPAYLVAFSLCVIPPIDAAMQTVPFRFGDPRWRFGFFGLMSNALMVPMLGLLIAFLVSSLFEHDRFQRVLGVIAAVIAVCTLGGLGMFALDVLQMHGQVKPGPYQTAFAVASGTAAIKSIIGVLTLAGFTWTAFSGTKRRASTPAAKSMIIGGSSRPSKTAPAVVVQPIDVE